TAGLTPDTAAVVEVGSGRCVLEVSGETARELLSRHLPLNLSNAAFPVGSCAQTAIGHIGVLLHAESPDVFALYVYCSFAHHLSEMLTDAALEFAGPGTLEKQLAQVIRSPLSS